MNNKKPLFLFLIGVEGSGHHLFQSFLSHFFRSETAIRNGGWLPYFLNRWDALQNEQKETRLTLNNQHEIRSEVEKMVAKHVTQTQFIYSSPSFPYGRDRDTLRRPDIIDMVEILSPYVDFRPIVIHRDPVSCSYSAVRRGFTDNVLHQARFVEDNLIFIKQQLEASGLEYRTLSYEDFVAQPNEYQTGLEQWWKVPTESFQEGLSQIRPSTSKSKIPSDIHAQLEEFFSPMRCKQWNTFLHSNDIRNVD